MATDLRTDRASTSSTRARFTHRLLFYSSDEQFLATAVPFLRDGLAEGDALLAVTGEANIRLLREALGAEADLVDFANTVDWYRHPARTLAAYRHYVDRHAGRRVRIIGEPIWPATEAEIRQWARYEPLCDTVFADSPVWCICAYHVRDLRPQILANALRAHPEQVVGTEAFPNPTYVPAWEWTGKYLRDDGFSEASAPVSAVAVGDHDLFELPHRVAEHAHRAGLAPHQTSELVLLVNEAVRKAAAHGGARGTVRFWCEGDLLVCLIGEVTAPPAPPEGWWARCRRRLVRRWSAPEGARPTVRGHEREQGAGHGDRPHHGTSSIPALWMSGIGRDDRDVWDWPG